MSWFMVLPVMFHSRERLAVQVRFLSQYIVLSAQLCALKLHRCVLLITPSLQSYNLEVEVFFSHFVPETLEVLTNF